MMLLPVILRGPSLFGWARVIKNALVRLLA